jgi:hypothetical protein
MPIEFQCPTCQARIRTPDDAAGKSARCPQCGGVSIVPGTPPIYAAGPPPEKPPANPFADQPLLQSTMNPYAPPAGPAMQAWPAQMTKEQARARLLGPAIGLIVFAIAGLGFMALLGIVMVADPDEVFKDVGQDPAEKAGAVGFFAAYFTVGLVTRIVQLLGAIAMLRARGYALAMAGAICAIIPCEIYCCLPCLPLGIWALAVLNNAQVKAAFQQ